MPRRVLLVCHVSAAGRAVAAAGGVWPGAELEVLAYGRSAERLPAPEGATLVSHPALSGSRVAAGLRLLRWFFGIRGRHDVVAVAQPSLALSRARGLLVAFPWLLGPREPVILDPGAGRVRRRVSSRLAVAELARWGLLQAGSRLLARAAAIALEAVAGERRAATDPLPHKGRVVYLRTDLDLAWMPLEAGGSVAHTEGILAALQRRGHEVELWTTGHLAGVPDGVRERRLPVALRGNVPTEIAELASGLLQAARAPGPPAEAFVYQRYSLNCFAGLLLARRWGVPLVLEANGSEAKWRTDWSTVSFPRLAFAAERRLLRGADRVPVVSRNAERDLLAAGGDAATVRVVPNGVAVERFAGAEPMPLPFAAGTFVVAFAGLFYPWHGVRFLAEAFPLLLERCPDARLLLVGDGEEAAHVRSVLATAGCLDRAHLPGLVPRGDVPRLLAAADVLVSPHAEVENFIGSPIKMFEYMASGRAIVASRLAQIGELLRDEETALLVTPEDPQALADALVRLHAEPELRARLGRAAQAEARREHSWDARLEAILR